MTPFSHFIRRLRPARLQAESDALKTEHQPVDYKPLDHEPLFRKRILSLIGWLLSVVGLFNSTQAALNASWLEAGLNVLSLLFGLILLHQTQRNALRAAGNVLALWIVFVTPAYSIVLSAVPKTILVSAPAILALISITASSRYAIAATTVLVTVASLSTWLKIESFSISPERSLQLGSILLLSLSVMSMVLFFYARVANKSRLVVTDLLNNERTMRHEQQQTNRALIETQVTSLTYPYWYDTEQQVLKFLAGSSYSEDDNIVSLDFDANHKLLASPGFEHWPAWLTDLCQRLGQLQNESWDCEIQCVDEHGKTRYFRSIGEWSTQEEEFQLHGIYQDITESKLLRRRLSENRIYDAGTGLLNRRELMKRLNDDLQVYRGDNYYYLLIDIDHFKLLNDSLSFKAGDALIERTASLVRSNLSEGDVAGRVGPDRIALLTRKSSNEEALAFADYLRSSFALNKFLYGGKSTATTLSVGMVYVAQEMESFEAIDQLAEMAVDDAKAMGRNRVVTRSYDDGGLQEQRNHTNWLKRFNAAVIEERFVLYAQQVLPAGSQQEEPRYELLVRMLDEEGNLVAPGEFLPVVEKYGLSSQLDLLVVDMAIKLCHSESVAGSFWVNLSGESISDAEFCAELMRRVALASLPNHKLNFEITETAVVSNLEVAINLMKSLQELGCLFALDDFGTGQASFAYLKELPIDVVKIDGHFIRQLATNSFDQQFTETMIKLAHSIGATTVAECVENEESAELLRAMQADYLQGFHLHKPCPLAELPRLAAVS